MRIIDHGTIVVLFPETDEDREWFKENVEGEPNWGGGYACDWRMAKDIIDAIQGQIVDEEWERITRRVGYAQ